MIKSEAYGEVHPCPICGAPKKNVSIIETLRERWTQCNGCGFQVVGSRGLSWNRACETIEKRRNGRQS